MSDQGQGKPPGDGTQYGFPLIDQQTGGEKEPRLGPTVHLPRPSSRRTNTAPGVGEAPVLARVEEELAGPLRFIAGTEPGHKAVSEDLLSGLKVEPAQRPLTGDVLPPRLSAWDNLLRPLRMLSPRQKLLGAVGVGGSLLLVVIIATFTCGGDPPAADEASTPAPAASEAAAEAATPAAPAPTPARTPLPVERATKATVAKPPAAEPAAPAKAPGNLLARARELLGQQLCPDAAKQARAQLETTPELAEAHALLGRAQSCVGDYAAAVKAYRAAVERDARLGADAQITADLGFMLSQEKVAQQAVEVLAAIGKPALELLVGAATHEVAAVRHRARAALEQQGESARIDWLTSLVLDLSQYPTCAQRRPVIARLGELADRRALKILSSRRIRRRNRCAKKELAQAIAKLRAATGSPVKKRRSKRRTRRR